METDIATYRHAELGLEELAAAVRHFVRLLEPTSSDGRVTSEPDARTLRYYQTLGVLPRPTRYEGRQAVYGYEHLLRAVCVKLMQSEGQSLAQIQRALAAAPPSRLETVVREALGSCVGDGVQVPAARKPLGADIAPPRLAAAAPRASVARRHPALIASHAPDAVFSTRSARPLAAAEVAPGVWAIVDPSVAGDADAVIARLERALHTPEGDH